WIGGEIRTDQGDGCTTRVGSFRRLRHRRTRKDRRVLRQRRRIGGIQEIQATIREPYEQLSLIRVFQDRRNALNRKVGNLPKFLEVGHGKRRNHMAVAERFGHEERLSIAGENNSGGAWRRIGTQRVQISIQQKTCAAPGPPKTAAKWLPSELAAANEIAPEPIVFGPVRRLPLGSKTAISPVESLHATSTRVWSPERAITPTPL